MRLLIAGLLLAMSAPTLANAPEHKPALLRDRLPHAAETRATFNQLFHPFSAVLADYRRARLLAHDAQNRARRGGR